MKIFVNGAPISLSKSDFLASGGQGEVYVKNSTAYKIYHDPARMIPLGKIQELAAITDSRVVKPDAVIKSDSGASIGYTMRRVEGHTLCSLFTRAFREREGLGNAAILGLIKQMQASVSSVHQAGVLIVDLNEMNFLAAPSFNEVYFLDADSYQTRSYPASALMESVRDRHAKANVFNTGTDWFAFAIVSFQMLIGIHPYKGRHAIKDLDQRMLQNVSVLDPSVSLPKAVYPFSDIPQSYRSWYEATFQRGERLPPPNSFTATAVAITRAIVTSTGIEMTRLADAIGLLDIFGDTVLTKTWLSVNGVIDRHPFSSDSRICQTRHGDIAVVSKTEVRFRGTTVPLPVAATQIMGTGGHVFVHSEEYILEVVLNDAGSRIVPSTRIALNCLPHATKLFPGCAIQNLLGTPYVSLFKGDATYTMRIPELQGHSVIDAKFDGALIVIAQKAGVYTRLVFRFNEDFSAYDVRQVISVASSPNFVCIDAAGGVIVLINEEEKIEVFSSKKDAAGIRIVEDTAIGGDMKLYLRLGRPCVSVGDVLYSIKMR